MDRLIVSGTHEATCGLAMQRPRPHDFHFLKAGNHESPKTRKPENAKARDQSFFVSDNCRCPSRRTPCMGGSALFRMRKNLRCATRKSASAKAGNRVSTNNKPPSEENGIPRKRENRKAGNRQGRVAIASSSTRRRQSWKASFRKGHRTRHHRSIACPDRLTGSLCPGSGLPNPLPVPTSTVVTFTCSSRTRSTRRIA